MPSFNTLWSHHPARQEPPALTPCMTGGTSNFGNQCVIRLGIAMAKSGLSLADYKGAFCWHGHGRSHPLRVEQFELWLQAGGGGFAPATEKCKRDKRGRQASYHTFLGRKGIAAFLDFHGADNTGDHIDLWNGEDLAWGGRNYFERSKEIWFWPLS